MKEKKREHYYLKAKHENYRSRAAYKLQQLQDKFQVLGEGMSCLDLGAAPGGWLQVEALIAGPGGRVFGIDISSIRPVEGVTVMRGDVTSPDVVDKLIRMTGGPVDVILSDMSPDISGNYSLDHARSVDLVRTALVVAGRMLRDGGNFVAKLFDGELTGTLLADVRELFQSARLSKPEASRKQSSEVYIVAKGFRK